MSNPFDPIEPDTRTDRAAAQRAENTGTFVALAVGISVVVVIGVFARVHPGQQFALNLSGFSSTPSVKSWLASIAFLLALVQIFSALVMYGRFPSITTPPWIGTLHRWSGRIAVLVTVPVAVHCVYAIGFKSGDTRQLIHSIFGCLFYGAFVSKMLILQRTKSPSWALPLLGGVVFTALVTLWLTSSLWYFATTGLKF